MFCTRYLWPWFGPLNDNAIRYVLPVLWMTPYFHTMGDVQILAWTLRRSELFIMTRQMAPLNCAQGRSLLSPIAMLCVCLFLTISSLSQWQKA